jgi:alpha/beta superfamily hydrolase
MTATHDSRNFFLPGPAGPLEALLWTPASTAPPALAAVLCHPHPLFGGTLHNNVVYNAAKALDALGVPVLRFNFRGTGLSAGTHDKGIGERQDVQTAIDFLAAEFPATPLLAAGFSFGSMVALQAGCADSRVVELIALGLPVNASDVRFLENCGKPKLFVHGANDAHGARTKIENLITRLPGENQLVIVEGADHFFAGHLDKLRSAITNWLLPRHPELGAT